MRAIRFLLGLLILAIPAASFGQIGIRVAFGPPELPVYEQPICPGDGYLWTPGYWAYDDSISDYYWVPGTWVEAPEVGFLWTPGYWGWGEGGYFFNQGYWGQNVGFYGGINYGFGYYGEGFGGGRWDHGHFFYNRSESHIDISINRNVYDERVNHGNANMRVSFNGGRGGIEARANSQQEAAARERHIPAIAAQAQHAQTARANPEMRATANHGRPPVTATSRPGELGQHPAAASNSGEISRPGGGEANGGHVQVHPKDLAPISRPAPVNSGNTRADRQYEQKQGQLIGRQTQERQNLQQKQDAEHQRRPNANTQQLEQKHQQQTQQLAQRHTTQQQSLEARQPQPRASNPGHGKN
jgi:hypothetical protein